MPLEKVAVQISRAIPLGSELAAGFRDEAALECDRGTMLPGCQDDVDAIGRIGAVRTILDVLCRTTGLGFAAVARVTKDRWICCSVRDEIGFGLTPGGELDVATTICNDVRKLREVVVIEDVAEDPTWCDHPAPAMYGFQSYVSMPILRKDGEFFGTLCAFDRRPAKLNTPDTIGMFRLFAELIAFHLDADEKLAAAETFQRSDALTRSILAATPDCVKVISADGILEYINERGIELSEYPKAATVIGLDYASFWPEEERDRVRGAIRRAAEGETVRLEGYCPTARGNPRWWEASFAPFKPGGEASDVRKVVSVTRDITDRRRAEEGQALLMREVDHRAKNALAVVQSVVRLTCASDTQSLKRAIEGRISALSRAQTLLAEDRWSGADLRSLLKGELAPFLGDHRADLAGPPVALPPGAAQPVAMAFHELATNALKHGALSVAGGRLCVSWWLDRQGGVAQLRLRWAEEGGPPVANMPERRGFGARVLQGTVSGQLGGAVALAWETTGLVCDLTIPLRTGLQPFVAVTAD